MLADCGKECQGWLSDGGLADFQFEVLLIEGAGGAFSDHADGDVAGFDAGRGELELGVGTDAISVTLQGLGVAMQRCD